MIHYYYGFGKGKTSSAVGAGMRAFGAGMSVLFVQFFKDNKSSERSVLPFEVYPCPDSLPFNVGEEYKEYIITGHNYLNELGDIADYVTRFEKIKHPYDSGVPARKGIEF